MGILLLVTVPRHTRGSSFEGFSAPPRTSETSATRFLTSEPPCSICVIPTDRGYAHSVSARQSSFPLEA